MGKIKFLFVVASLIPLVIYLKTLLPGLGFWDTAEFQTIAYTMDIAHPPGYPTYIILGKIFTELFPLNSIAFRMNFFSALTSALAGGFLAITIYALTKRFTVSLFCSLFFSLSEVVWSISLRAEVHSLHLLFTAVLFCLAVYQNLSRRKDLIYPLFFILGLSFGNHLLTLFFVPSALLLTARSFKIQHLALFVLGLLVYLLLPIVGLLKPPLTVDYNLATVDGFLRHVTGRDFNGFMHGWVGGSLSSAMQFYYRFLSQFFWLFVPGLIGFILTFRKFLRLNIIFIIFVVGTLGFSLRYQNAVLERYFIPSFLVLSIWAGVGLGGIWSLTNKLLRGVLVLILIALLFYEVKNNYVRVDQSGNISAYNFATEALESCDGNAIIFSWWSYSTPLWYMTKVEKLRSDVAVYNTGQGEWEGKGEELTPKRQVYFIENITLHNPEYKLVPAGSLYKLEKL